MKNARQTKMKWCEVVRVDSPLFLVSSNHHACRYETSNDQPLAAGYYLVMGPAGTSQGSYDKSLCFIGPFATKHLAQLLQISAIDLGVIPSERDAVDTPVKTRHERVVDRSRNTPYSAPARFSGASGYQAAHP